MQIFGPVVPNPYDPSLPVDAFEIGTVHGVLARIVDHGDGVAFDHEPRNRRTVGRCEESDNLAAPETAN